MNRQAEAHEARVAAAEAAGYTVEYQETGGVIFRRPDASVQLFFMEMSGRPSEFLDLLDDWCYYRHLNAPAVVAAIEQTCREQPQEDPEFIWAVGLESARKLYRQRLVPHPWPMNLGFWNVHVKEAIPLSEWPEELRKRMGKDFYTVEGLRTPMRPNAAGSVDY